MSSDTLSALAALIKQRAKAAVGTSYTRQLLDAGPQRCAKKFGEEAIETVIAATAQSPVELTAEAADVVYHLLVLLESRGVAWADVLATLEGRMGTSGLDEKAARPSSQNKGAQPGPEPVTKLGSKS
jgi:phosphoribosyl-ATP pyrophosphohydrolase